VREDIERYLKGYLGEPMVTRAEHDSEMRMQAAVWFCVGGAVMLMVVVLSTVFLPGV
jgi:hypothetical protein